MTTRTLPSLFLCAYLALAAAILPPLRNSTVELDDSSNLTITKETVVDVQVSPPEEVLDLAGVYMHQASKGLQTMLKSGTHILDPFADFFRELFAHLQPQQPSLPPLTRDRRKLYVI